MLSFVQQILAFATFEVLEPNWRMLEAKLENVTTVDQLLRDHVDFLDTCLKECMLTSSKLLRVHPFFFTYLVLILKDSSGVLEVDCDLLNLCSLHFQFYKVGEPGHHSG